MADAPFHHGTVLLPAGRRKIDEIGNVAQHGNVVEPDVRDVVHAEHRTHEHVDEGRVAVDAKVLGNLVVGALYESAVDVVDRTYATLGHAGNHGYGLLLGNAHIDKLFARLFTSAAEEACHGRRARGHRHEVRVVLHLLEEESTCQFAIVFCI